MPTTDYQPQYWQLCVTCQAVAECRRAAMLLLQRHIAKNSTGHASIFTSLISQPAKT